MKKILKFGAGILSAILVLIILAIVGIGIYLQTDSGQRMIRERVNSAIAGEILWDGAEISLLRGRAGLYEIRVNGPDGQTIIDADRVFVNIGLINIFSGQIRIQNARFERPRARLAVDSRGNLNIAEAFSSPGRKEPPPPKEEEDGPALDVFVEHMELTGGRFEYLIAPRGPDQSPQSIDLRKIYINLKNADLGGRSGDLSASIGGGALDMAGIKTELRKFALDGTLEGGNLDPVSLEIETDGLGLTLTGSISRLFEDPRMDLVLDLAGDLSFIREIIDPEMDMSGPLRLEARAAGALDNPDVLLEARYAGGTLPGMAVEAIDLTARMKNLQIEIDPLEIHTEPGTLSGKGTVSMEESFDGSLLSGKFDVSALSYDLILDTAGLALELLPWTEDLLAGNIGGNIRLEGTGVMPDELTARTSVKLEGRQVAVRDALAPTDLELTGEAAMSKGSIRLDPLSLSTRDSTVRVEGTYGIFENLLDLSLDLQSPDLAQILSPLDIPVVSGKTRLRIEAAGPVMQPEAAISMKSESLSYQEITVGDLVLDCRLAESGKMIVENLRITNRDSVISAEGSILLFEGSFANINESMPADMTANLDGVNISDFTTAIDIKGVIDGTARVKDTILNPTADLEVDAKDVVYQGQEYGNLTARLHLSGGSLNIEQISLEKGKSRLGLSGVLDMMNYTPPTAPAAPQSHRLPEVGYPGGIIAAAADVHQETGRDKDESEKLSFETPRLDLKFEDSVIHAEEFTDAASGRIAIDGYIRGPVNDISAVSARLDIDGSSIEAQGFSVGDLSARIALENALVMVNDLTIQNGGSELTVTGTIDPFEPGGGIEVKDAPGLDLEISGKQVLLGDFIDDVSGRLSVNGRIGGTLKDLYGNMDIQGREIDLGVQQIQSIQISTRLDGQRVHLEPAVVALAPEDRIKAEGWVSTEQEYEIFIGSDPLDLRRIGVFSGADIDSGTLSLDFSGKGTFSDPRLAGSVRIAELAFEGKTVPDLVAEIALENFLARINADLTFPVTAGYNLETGDFSANAEMAETDLDPYFRIAGLGGLSGQITAQIDASGNASAIEDARGKLEIDNLAIFDNSRNLLRVPGLSAVFEKGRYDVSQARISLLDDGYLDIRGSGSISGDLDFHAEGMLPLRVAGSFVEGLGEAGGKIIMKADFTGSVNDPGIDAVAELDRIGMTLPVLDQELRDLSGRIRITDSRIDIENVNGRLDTGKFSISGGFDLKDLLPVSGKMDISSYNLPIEIPDMAEMVINTELTFKGTPEDSVLTGSITLLEGVYYQDVKVDVFEAVGEIGQRQREVQPGIESEPMNIPFLNNLRFDVQIGYRNPFIVDNNIALMSITPELRFTGSMEQPLLNGRAEVTEGTITFRNNEFSVEQGLIDFLDPYRIVPTVDIQAETEVRRWDITLSVSGPPDNLDFRLSSNPSEEDADILSLLLTGRTTAELDEGVGGGGRSPQEMLAGVIANRLAEDVGATTGLDIEVGYNKDGTGRTSQGITPDGRSEVPAILPEATPGTAPGDTAGTGDTVQVTVGKDLSRRLSLKFGIVRRSGEVVQQQTAIYRLLENLSVNAFQDTEGIFGGEMRFRLEFR